MILMNIMETEQDSVRPEGEARRDERLEGLNGNTDILNQALKWFKIKAFSCHRPENA